MDFNVLLTFFVFMNNDFDEPLKPSMLSVS